MGELPMTKAKAVDLSLMGKAAITSVGSVGCTLACVKDEKCTVSVYDKITQQCWFMTMQTKAQLLTDASPGDPDDQTLFTVVVTEDRVCSVEAMQITESCQAQLDYSHHTSGVYCTRGQHQEPVFQPCHPFIHGPEWTVIQRRVDASVNFYRKWQDYQWGFGNPDANFWLGLETIYQLCKNNCELFVYMVDKPGDEKCSTADSAYAHYTTFRLNSAYDAYRQTIANYSGTAGDALTLGNGYRFSAYDWDNDASPESCAQGSTGAWWYASCHLANPNGQYLNGPHPGVYAKGINWYQYKGFYYSVKYIEMRVKPV